MKVTLNLLFVTLYWLELGLGLGMVGQLGLGVRVRVLELNAVSSNSGVPIIGNLVESNLPRRVRLQLELLSFL